jgi:ubiquinone/menaquinone biosynthesis C-methylase UbiE
MTSCVPCRSIALFGSYHPYGSSVDARLQRRVQRYGWDKAAPVYEQFWARQLEPAHDRLLGLAQLRPNDRVLDVACGTGLITFRAADLVGPGGAVLGTDIADAMVVAIGDEAARRRIGHVRAERSDAEELAVDDDSFDVVLCAFGLMYVADPVQALRQARRVLRPGGRLVVSVWGARSRCGWAEIFPIVERRVASEVCPLFFQLGTGDALSYALESAGFQVTTVERMAPGLRYASGEDACGAAFAGGPVALAYSRFDPATRDEVHAEYLESISAYRAGEGYIVPGEFVIARADKSAGQGAASPRAGSG